MRESDDAVDAARGFDTGGDRVETFFDTDVSRAARFALPPAVGVRGCEGGVGGGGEAGDVGGEEEDRCGGIEELDAAWVGGVGWGEVFVEEFGEGFSFGVEVGARLGVACRFCVRIRLTMCFYRGAARTYREA